MIHETTHGASTGDISFLHFQMDQAAYDVAKNLGLPKIGNTPLGERPLTPALEGDDTAASYVFDNLIFHFCGNGVKR